MIHQNDLNTISGLSYTIGALIKQLIVAGLKIQLKIKQIEMTTNF